VEPINKYFAGNVTNIKIPSILIRSLAYAKYVLKEEASQLEALFSTSPCLESVQEQMKRRKMMMSTPSLMS
jgi:hypothetical protein